MTNTVSQWVILFFIYSFFGWIWETAYVSVRKRHFVNRGFLFGPVLPIYGYGAIIILAVTLPVRNSIPFTFLAGMTGATLLEYVTGVVMESIFKVRYWDYSDRHLNLNGHICLYASMGWGVFSVLLVRIIDPHVEKLLHLLPEPWLQPVSFLAVALMAVDTTKSVQEAISLRELLKRLTESNRVFGELEERITRLSSNIASETEEIQEQVRKLSRDLENFKKDRTERLSAYLENRRSKNAMRMLKRNPDSVSVAFKEKLTELKEAAQKNLRRKSE